jgi:hypothetical protein
MAAWRTSSVKRGESGPPVALFFKAQQVKDSLVLAPAASTSPAGVRGLEARPVQSALACGTASSGAGGAAPSARVPRDGGGEAGARGAMEGWGGTARAIATGDGVSLDVVCIGVARTRRSQRDRGGPRCPAPVPRGRRRRERSGRNAETITAQASLRGAGTSVNSTASSRMNRSAGLTLLKVC